MHVYGRLLFCIAVLNIVLLPGCARHKELIPFPEKHVLLMKRVHDFYEGLVNKKYDRMYALLSDENRKDTPKQEYTTNLKGTFHDVTIIVHPPEILRSFGGEAVTRAIVFLSYNGNNAIACSQLVWTWEHENWFISGGDEDGCEAPVGKFIQ